MNKSDTTRNAYITSSALSKRGYQRWWHSFTGIQPDTGEERVFFIEYFIVNPALDKGEPVLGQLPYNKKRGIPPSYVMIKAGAFGADAKQLHAYYSASKLRTATQPFVLAVEDNFYSENHIYGYVEVNYPDSRRKSFMCDEGYMEWDLEVYKELACHTGHISNPLFCAMNTMKTFWHAEGLKTYYRGTVILDGVMYKVTADNCYGYADKHWGRNFNYPWLQFTSSCLISEKNGRALKQTALAITSCCPKFLCFPLKKKLLFQLTYQGEDYNFFFSSRGLRRRMKWNIKASSKRIIWRLVSQDKDIVIKLTGSFLRENMLTLHYEDPGGCRPVSPLLADGNGQGKLLIYRKTSAGKQPIDTLTIEKAFCIYDE